MSFPPQICFQFLLICLFADIVQVLGYSHYSPRSRTQSLSSSTRYNPSSEENMIKNAATYVKERVVLSALISRYAKLTPVSDTSYKTNCMFHKDNDPSMMVNDSPVSSPYFYCFSCGESGDFLKLLSTKANVAKSKVLWSSYEALQSGKTVEE